jgi:hypothetical protein
MKKKYIKPTMEVVQLQHKTMLLSGSPADQSNNNADIKEEITTGSGTGRARGFDGWDDEEDWGE